MIDFAWKDLRDAQTWIIKVGSSVLADGDRLSTQRIESLCNQINTLMAMGKKIVIVSSGAILEGTHRLGFKRRPHRLYELQAAAAVGQMGLFIEYEKRLAQFNLKTAAILLTHDDISDRLRYLNARATVSNLLSRGVIPVVNENDTVATDEIEFGDNDTLAARIASLVDADILVLLTDQRGLHECDPRVESSAELIDSAKASDPKLDGMVSVTPGILGRGGMKSKLEAARHAAKSGCHTIIADGRTSDELCELAQGQSRGTLLTASITPRIARKQWIAGQVKMKGELRVDDGAVEALTRNGVSLLAVGVTAVKGNFSRGDFVRVTKSDGTEIGKGIVNYGSLESKKIQGRPTNAIEEILGFIDERELVHRDNLVLT